MSQKSIFETSSKELVKSWEEANESERRVLCAKDVIARVNSGQFDVVSGAFISILNPEADLAYLGSEIAKNTKCQVCADGALFLSQLLFSEDIIHYKNCDELFIDDGSQKSIFEYDQFRLIELAFEGGHGYWEFSNYNALANCENEEDISVGDGTPEECRAMAFYLRYPDETERLLAIMENLVENQGSFTP